MGSRKSPLVGLVTIVVLLLVALTPALSPTTPGIALPGHQLAPWPRIDLRLITPLHDISSPVHLTHAGDDSDRIFVVERGGRIRLIRDGTLLETPFLDITERTTSTGQEDGLLSIAFPPGYMDKGYFYLFYTNIAGDIVIARFLVTTDPDIADPTTEESVLVIPHPDVTHHHGGQLAFGPRDGYLYIGTGDGGEPPDGDNAALDKGSLLGKILRIDVESGHVPYRIPPDNPFAGVRGARPEIWAMGLRNPWRFAFDRENGDLYIADVGHARREEINVQAAGDEGGSNYGWPYLEGSLCFYPDTVCIAPEGYVPPVIEYSHDEQNRAVTGGYVYRGPDSGFLQGLYLFADVYSGHIWGARHQGERWETSRLYDASFYITSFGEDQAGNLYVVAIDTGGVYRIEEVTHDGPLYLPLVSDE